MTQDRAQDITDVRPTSLNHVVGQQQIVEAISTTLDYCFQDHVPFPHTLMLGPPGLGKTEITKIIAEEQACGFHELLASAIRSPADFFGVLLCAKRGDIVFLDELDCLDKALQTALLTATADRKIYVPSAAGGAPHAIDLEPITIVGATTEEYGILRPLADRFRLTLRYQYYSVPELVEIVRRRCKGLDWQIEEEVLEPIAVRSQSVPRLALRIAQSCWRACRAGGSSTITAAHLDQVCRLESIDELGLDFNQQRLMSLLEQGPMRLNVLATVLGIPSKTVSSCTECFLIRNGLITKDKNGLRHLTQRGREHVANKPRPSQ